LLFKSAQKYMYNYEWERSKRL